MNPQALDHIVLDRITAGRDPAPNTGQAHASSSSTDNHSEAASIILRLVQDLKQVLLDYENDRRHLQNLKIHLAQNEQLATFLTHQALINAHRIAQIEQLLENGPVTGEEVRGSSETDCMTKADLTASHRNLSMSSGSSGTISTSK